MIEFIRNLFSKSDDNLDSFVEQNSDVGFVLKVDILTIGTLKFSNGFWFFQYSDAFRNQKEYNRLVGFSDLNKVYESEVLWPFFKIRIPGLKQPMVKEIIEAEKINKNDEASLLKRFGKHNISNPYILEIA